MDFMMLAAMTVGLIAMYFYFKESHGGSGCGGVSGNCVYNTCKHDYCWRGLVLAGTPNESVVQVCALGMTNNPTIAQGCNQARNNFMYCTSHKTDPKCRITYVPGNV